MRLVQEEIPSNITKANNKDLAFIVHMFDFSNFHIFPKLSFAIDKSNKNLKKSYIYV